MGVKVSESAVAMGLDPRVFELIILPTEKCNFRCTYCYEDFKIGRMKRPTIDALKRLITGRAEQVEFLSLSWFGGEPMLADSVIYEIAEHASLVGSSSGMRMNGGLTTNGYLLTEERLRRLHALKHRNFQITLDGPGDVHDQSRRLANGKGTFEQIWRNLLLIRDLELDFDVTLRVHVSAENHEKLPVLLERIDSELRASNKFRIHFHRISNLGGPGGSTVQPLSWSGYSQILAGLTNATNVSSSSEKALVDAGAICYAAKPNSLLIRADGRVGKCTVALDDPRNHVGDLLPDGTIEFFSERLRLWFEGYRDMDADVLGCPLPSLGEDPLLERVARRPIAVALA
jgi:uncharacterized protein